MIDRSKVKIIESNKRKTIGLEIGTNGGVKIRVPAGTPEQLILKVLQKKADWIDRKIAEAPKVKKNRVKKEFVSGEGFLYLGRSYKLYLVSRGSVNYKKNTDLYFDKGFFLKKEEKDRAVELFEEWYKDEALKILKEEVRRYLSHGNFEVNKVKISWAKKRWGSYSQKTKNLNFNWRIVMAPLTVIKYIVVHELVHSDYPNHSKNFWDRVKTIYPDYKKARDWLENNYSDLIFDYSVLKSD